MKKSHKIEDYDNIYELYGEGQGFYYRNYNGTRNELISQFDNIEGINTFYKKLGLKFNESRYLQEQNLVQEPCLVYRLEPIDTTVISQKIYFKLFVKSTDSLKLKKSQIDIHYNTDFLGTNVVVNNKIGFTKGGFNNTYNTTLTDISTDVLRITHSSNAIPNQLDLLSTQNEILVGTFEIDIQGISGDDPFYLGNTNYENQYYPLNATSYIRSFCGQLTVNSYACDISISSISTSLSAGTGSIIEITGTDLIHDTATEQGVLCNLPGDEHRVKFKDVNGSWISPLEGDYVEWTNTSIKVKVPTEGYINNSFNPTTYSTDEIAASGFIRVCINNNLFDCTCYEDSPQDLDVSFAIPSLHVDNHDNCQGTRYCRLFSDDNDNDISFDVGTLTPDQKNAFIEALNTWRCELKIEYNISSVDGIDVSFGNTPSGMLGVTSLGTSSCPADGEKLMRPIQMVFDSTADFQYGSLPIPNNKYDFQTVALHEIGHALGLLHTNDNNDLMHPTLDKKVEKRQLKSNEKLGGNFNKNKSFDPINCSNANPVDPLTGDCNIPTRVNSVNTDIKLVVFPNPTSDKVKIESDEQILSIKILDSSLKEVLEFDNVNSKNVLVDISSLKTGTYIVQAQMKFESFKSKIIKL